MARLLLVCLVLVSLYVRGGHCGVVGAAAGGAAGAAANAGTFEQGIGKQDSLF